MSAIDLRVRSVISLSSAEGWWIEVEYRKFEPLAAFGILEAVDEDGGARGVPVPLTLDLMAQIREDLLLGSLSEVPYEHLLRELYHRSAFISEGKVLYEDI